MADVTGGAWSETAFVAITKKGGSDVEFKTLIENFNTSGGAKDFNSIATIGAGRIKAFTPQEDFEVTLEGYATEAGTDTGTTGKGFFDLMHTQDTSQAQSISVDTTRDEYQLVILWTDDTSVTSATDEIASGSNALRYTFKNGHFTNVETDFGDKVAKFTVTFKCTPFDKSGTANVTRESTDDSTTLSAVSAYS